MERFELHIEAESRIRWKVYVRFGGEFSETDHSNMARRRLLSLRTEREAGSTGNASQSGGNSRTAGSNRTSVVGTAQ